MLFLENESPAVSDWEGQPHRHAVWDTLFARVHEPSVLSAQGNQAVQSILSMNTDEELWQEGGEENVQYRKMQLKKSHFYILQLYLDYNWGGKSHFSVEEERPLHLLTLWKVFTFLLYANKILLIWVDKEDWLKVPYLHDASHQRSSEHVVVTHCINSL